MGRPEMPDSRVDPALSWARVTPGAAILVDFAQALFLLGLAGFVFSGALEAVRCVLLSRDEERGPGPPLARDDRPLVTIQLPVCDERFVVERLIDGCCALDYPADRVEIQVLDDSTDDTTELVARKVAEHSARGVAIAHLRRPDRAGFKAGNLQYGWQAAHGEFIAVFDADCVPDPDFLLETLPHFHDPRVGIVCAGTRHLNADHSALTRAQDPDGPAASRGTRRYYAGRVINVFPGSAGVLRAACLHDIGGWQGDTLAEDHDVSLRAYLHGWRCVQLRDRLASDAVQDRMADFKNRVARCNTGPVECYRKHLLRVLRDDRLTASQKVTLLPTLHCAWLTLSSVALLALASGPLVLEQRAAGVAQALYLLPSLVVVALLLYVAAARTALLATALLYIGTCFRGGWGTLRGLAGVRSSFQRSTKSGPRSGAAPSQPTGYAIRITPATFLEGALALYFALALYLGVQTGNIVFVPLHGFCAVSCGFVFTLSVAELW
jgi:cellulose synthase/poly-beta-1,6-N-acetylglucosamine synthase-like glycosyltransferase